MTTRQDYVSGKTLVVTGAAGGFGRLVCERALARGANVVGGDVSSGGLSELADALGAPDRFAPVETDVTDLGAMKALLSAAVERFGTVDVMLNNAGVMPLAFFADHVEAAPAWDRCIDINIKGVLHGMIAAYTPMMEQGRGHVINVSSIYGNHPVVGAAVYGASKAAVNVLSESFRVETQGKIKVTIVKPTGVPGTGLATGVVNPGAIAGIVGQNTEYLGFFAAMAEGKVDPADLDPESVRNRVLAPEYIAEAILSAIDQPWGVSLGDITVRATGDAYIL